MDNDNKSWPSIEKNFSLGTVKLTLTTNSSTGEELADDFIFINNTLDEAIRIVEGRNNAKTAPISSQIKKDDLEAMSPPETAETAENEAVAPKPKPKAKPKAKAKAKAKAVEPPQQDKQFNAKEREELIDALTSKIEDELVAKGVELEALNDEDYEELLTENASASLFGGDEKDYDNLSNHDLNIVYRLSLIHISEPTRPY